MAFHNGEIANISFLYRNILLARQIGYKKEHVIGNCETKVKYRGNSVYPHMLTKILEYCREHKRENILIFVGPDNRASIKGIERAGFKFQKRAKILRFLGFCLEKRFFF
jgi:predicted acetyltransferase